MCGWITSIFHCYVCNAELTQKLTLPIQCKEHRDANREWGTLGHVARPFFRSVNDHSRACGKCDPTGAKYPNTTWWSPGSDPNPGMGSVPVPVPVPAPATAPGSGGPLPPKGT
jgi:hypothetical protein